jgi:hypothetical protein
MVHRIAAASLLVVALASCTSADAPRGSYGMGDQTSPNVTAAPAPAMNPGRKIVEQDCSKAVSMDEGNLKCK